MPTVHHVASTEVQLIHAADSPRSQACSKLNITTEGAYQVHHNGATFEHRKVIVVVVHNGRDTSVGVDLEVPWLFLLILTK
jgi:hypothetical protein